MWYRSFPWVAIIAIVLVSEQLVYADQAWIKRALQGRRLLSSTCNVCTRREMASVQPSYSQSASHQASHGDSFGIAFTSLPTINSATNNIELNFEFGAYRPGYNESHAMSCYTDSARGMFPLDGAGYAADAADAENCRRWGEEYGTGNRGFSPALTIITIGDNYRLDVTKPDSQAFGHAFEQRTDKECSPQRLIADKSVGLFHNYTVQQLADALYTNDVTLNMGDRNASTLNTRANCQAFTEELANTSLAFKSVASSHVAIGSEDLASLYSANMPFAYGVAADADQPLWNFKIAYDDVTPNENGARCASRFKVHGQMVASMDKISTCKAYVDDTSVTAGYAWKNALEQSVENPGAVNEKMTLKFPVCMYRLSATKSRGSHAKAQLVKEKSCVGVNFQTTSTNAFTTSDTVNFGKAVDLPITTVRDIDLVTGEQLVVDPSGVSGMKLVAVTETPIVNRSSWVDTKCYDQCVTSFGGIGNSNCDVDQECEHECMVAVDTAGRLIANSFGNIGVNLAIETVRSSSVVVPYVQDARTFHNIASGVGSVNLYNVQIKSELSSHPYTSQCAVGQSDVSTDTSTSYATLVSRRKRLLKISTGEWEQVEVTLEGQQGMVFRQKSGTKLTADADVFSRIDTPKTCSVAQRFATVDPAFPYSTGHFSGGADYGFQLQLATCTPTSTWTQPTSTTAQCFDPEQIFSDDRCSFGVFKTIDIKVHYNVEQQYVNPEQISEAIQIGVYQGIGSINDASFSSFASANTAIASSKINTGDFLRTGQPFEIVTHIDNSPLGEHFTMQQKTVNIAIKMVDCDPHNSSSTSYCDRGYVTGKCGVKLNQEDIVTSKHALASVVQTPLSASSGVEVPSRADMVLRLRTQNLWYTQLKTKLVEDAVSNGKASAASVNETSEVCWLKKTDAHPATLFHNTTSPLDNLDVQRSAIQNLYCIESELSSAWHGKLALSMFLTKVNENTCPLPYVHENNDSPGTRRLHDSEDPTDDSAFFLCLGALPDGICTNIPMTPRDADGTAGKPRSCLGGQPASTDSREFIAAYQLIEVVNDYSLRGNQIRDAGFSTMAELSDPHCLRLTEVTKDGTFQRLVMDSENVRCNGLKNMISPSFEMILKARNYVPQRYSLATEIGGSVQAAGRHQQCVATTKSSAMQVGMRQEESIVHRNWLKNSIYFGSALTIPCVEREAYMVATVTDTRRPDVCKRAAVTCENGDVTVSKLSAIKSGVTLAPTGSTWIPSSSTTAEEKYTLYVASAADQCHQYASATNDTSRCGPIPYNANAAPAIVEGLEVDMCGATYSFDYTETLASNASVRKGLRWKSGALEYFEATNVTTVQDLQKLDARNGRLVYVLPQGATPPSSYNFTKLTCGSTSSNLHLPGCSTSRRANTAETIVASVPVDADQMSSRRSEQDLATGSQVTIAAGEAAVETCETTIRISAQCSLSYGYIRKVNYDTLKCSDNTGGECSHSYCCQQYEGDAITVNNYNGGGPCTDMNQYDTKMAIAFTTTLLLGSSMVAIIGLNLVIVKVAVKYYPRSSLARKSDMNPNWRVILVVLSIGMLGSSFVLGAVGNESGDWLDQCGYDNWAAWAIWFPATLTAAVVVHLVIIVRSNLLDTFVPSKLHSLKRGHSATTRAETPARVEVTVDTMGDNEQPPVTNNKRFGWF